MFDEVRKQIQEEDLAKNKERFEELLRVQVPEVSGFSESLESHGVTELERELTN